MTRPIINPEKFWEDLEALAKFGRQPDGAIHRVAYSPIDGEARAWLKYRLRTMGLDPTDDAIGNTIAQYPGQTDLPPIAIGSHSDTVPYGGAYDGALGVVAALAVVEALVTTEVTLRHPLAWINFAAEEATMAGGTMGSQGLTGQFNPALLDKTAWDGRPVREHFQAAGLDPKEIRVARRRKGSFAAFVEVHIEQSRRLEDRGIDIGIVDGFVGIWRFAVSFEGVANHAGTTPMDQRDDALIKAAPLIQFVRDMAIELGIVGTIGNFSVSPGSPNVIPNRVEAIVELRALDTRLLEQAQELLEAEVARLDGSCDVVIQKSPVKVDALIREAITVACDSLNFTHITMSSGAGHDAMVMSKLCPQGIFFIPSRAGISHSKDEFSTPEQCLTGAQVLLETVLRLDEMIG